MDQKLDVDAAANEALEQYRTEGLAIVNQLGKRLHERGFTIIIRAHHPMGLSLVSDSGDPTVLMGMAEEIKIEKRVNHIRKLEKRVEDEVKNEDQSK